MDKWDAEAARANEELGEEVVRLRQQRDHYAELHAAELLRVEQAERAAESVEARAERAEELLSRYAGEVRDLLDAPRPSIRVAVEPCKQALVTAFKDPAEAQRLLREIADDIAPHGFEGSAGTLYAMAADLDKVPADAESDAPVHCTAAQPCEQASPKEPADSLAGREQGTNPLAAEPIALLRAYEERHTSATVLGSLASVVLRDLAPLGRPAPADRSEAPTREDGASLIAAERQRQVESEHWTAENDDGHTKGELAWAAVCYASPETVYRVHHQEHPADHRGTVGGEVRWREPWPSEWVPNKGRGEPGRVPWRRSSEGGRLRELVKAGGLIAAEIDRLLRIRDEGGRE